MKSKKVFTVLIIALCFIFSNNLATKVEAKSILITNHYIESNINQNGSMDVEEKITYQFSGQHNGIFKNISFDKAEGIQDLKIYKSEYNDFKLINDQSLYVLPNNNSGSPNTYSYAYEGKMQKIKLYTPSYNTTKTYVFKYRINGVINKYNDIAELYWKFIPSTNETPNKNVEIIIHTPQGSIKEDLRVFAHGPLTGLSEIVNDNTIRLSIDNLPAYNYVEGRILFPNKLISDSYPIKNISALNKILQEESGWAEQANYQRQTARENINRYIQSNYNKTFKGFAWLYPLFAFGIMILLKIIEQIRIRVNRPKPDYDYDYYRELPEDCSPAVVSFLMDNNVELKDISATILDLVRRGYLTITQHTNTQKVFFFKKEMIDYIITLKKEIDYNDLKDHEIFLIQWFVDELGDSNSVNLKQIQNDIKRSESSARQFREKLLKWQKTIKDEAKNMKLMEETKLPKYFAIINIIISTFGVCLISLSSTNYFCIIILTASLKSLIGTYLTKSQNGFQQYYKWEAFRKYLKDFSLLNEAEVPSLIIWEHFLVYAISLGVAEKVIEQLKLTIPPEEFNNSNLTYLHSNNGFVFASTLSSLENTFENINSSAIANSYDSSSDGFGGGFSGGGGFGGGDGGGDGGF